MLYIRFVFTNAGKKAIKRLKDNKRLKDLGYELSFCHDRFEIHGDMNDEELYESDGITIIPTLIRITDQRRNWQGNIASELEEPKIRNIEFDSIYLHVDEEIDQVPAITIEKCIERSVFANISIQNVFMNGKPFDTSSISIS